MSLSQQTPTPQQMPTLDEFIDIANRQGCRVKYATMQIVGSKGRAPAKYMIRDFTNKLFAILPDIEHDERLSLTQLQNLVRVLKITGFENLLENPND
jgi:hypothetical protein